MSLRLVRPAGTAEPQRVLMLHGIGGSPAMWDRFAACAAPELELWDADLPWTGGGDGQWSQLADPTRWVREALDGHPGGFDVVIAHSFAANLVLELLSQDRAPRARTAVLISPFYRPAPDDFDWATIAFYLNDFHRILDEGLRVVSPPQLPAGLRGQMAARVRERIGPYGWMRFFDAYLRTPSLDLDAIRAPLLVISGDRDFAAPASGGRDLSAAVPHGRFHELDDCGHFAMIERPEHLAALLTDFLHTLDAHLELT